MNTNYKNGWRAYANHERISVCPFERGTREQKDWCHGWFDASRDPVILAERSTELYFAMR